MSVYGQGLKRQSDGRLGFRRYSRKIKTNYRVQEEKKTLTNYQNNRVIHAYEYEIKYEFVIIKK